MPSPARSAIFIAGWVKTNRNYSGPTAAHAGYKVTIDLPVQTVTTPAGKVMRFEIDATRKENMVGGLDEIGLTLKHSDEIKAYEEKRKKSEPWIFS